MTSELGLGWPHCIASWKTYIFFIRLDGINSETKANPPETKENDVKKPATATPGGARQNWKKLFAVRKFLSLAQYQSKASPAQLLVANRYVVGKKIANGAFGQLRVNILMQEYKFWKFMRLCKTICEGTLWRNRS